MSVLILFDQSVRNFVNVHLRRTSIDLRIISVSLFLSNLMRSSYHIHMHAYVHKLYTNTVINFATFKFRRTQFFLSLQNEDSVNYNSKKIGIRFAIVQLLICISAHFRFFPSLLPPSLLLLLPPLFPRTQNTQDKRIISSKIIRSFESIKKHSLFNSSSQLTDQAKLMRLVLKFRTTKVNVLLKFLGKKCKCTMNIIYYIKITN